MLGIILLVIWSVVVYGCLFIGAVTGETAAGVLVTLVAAIILGVIFLAIWSTVTVFSFIFSGAPPVVIVAAIILLLLIIL